MRQLIVLTVILLSVQVIKAGIVPAAPISSSLSNDFDCLCQDKVDKLTRAELEQLLRIFKSSNDALQASNEQKSCTITNLNRDLEAGNDKLTNQIKANELLQKKLDESLKNGKDCAAKLSDCQNHSADCIKKYSDLDKSYQKLKIDYDSLKAKCALDSKACADETDRLNRIIEDLTCRLEQEKNNRRKCEDDLQALKKKYEELTDKHNTSLNIIEDHKLTIKQLKKLLEEEEQDDECFKRQIADLITQLDLLKCENSDLKNQIACLTKELAEQKEKCAKKTAELLKQIEQIKIDCNNALEQEREKTRLAYCRIADLEAELEKLNNQLCQTQQELDQCKKDRINCENKNKELQKIITDLECTITGLKATISDLECNISDLKKDLKDCQDKNQKCSAELEKCRRDLENSLLIIEQQKCTIVELEEALEKCRCELATFTCEADQFVNQLIDDTGILTTEAQELTLKAAAINGNIKHFHELHEDLLNCDGTACLCEN